MTAKTIAFSSCWHGGSPVGACPESYSLPSANGGRRVRITPNKVQGVILDKMNEMARDIGKVDYLVLMGDICEGTRQNADAFTKDGSVQVDMMSVMLSKFKYKKLIVIQGSEYHTGFNPSLDAYFAMKNGGIFDEEMYLKINGHRFNLKHAVGVGADEGGRQKGIGDEMKKVKAREEEYGKTDVVVRGHAHYFTSAMNAYMEGIVVPCFKGKDAFLRRGPSNYVPELGYVYGTVDDKGFSWTPEVFMLKGTDLVTEVS